MNELHYLGRYQIEAYLGSGAYADVYRATDTVLKRTVALKVLKSHLLADEEAFNRFVREAQVASDLVHPHIAWVWDVGESQGYHYLVIRFVDGRSLDQILKERGPLPWQEALQIVEQVASALGFAHKKGLVHRDIKPQNILVSTENSAVLTDFGLVKAMQASGLSTHSGVVIGTYSYIPPEIWKDEPATPASDQYALACVFVEMLTGEVLFNGSTPPAIMARHFEPFVLPQNMPEDTPLGLEKILERALAKEPEERYGDLHEFVANLKELERNPVPQSSSMKVQNLSEAKGQSLEETPDTQRPEAGDDGRSSNLAREPESAATSTLQQKMEVVEDTSRGNLTRSYGKPKAEQHMNPAVPPSRPRSWWQAWQIWAVAIPSLLIIFGLILIIGFIGLRPLIEPTLNTPIAGIAVASLPAKNTNGPDISSKETSTVTPVSPTPRPPTETMQPSLTLTPQIVIRASSTLRPEAVVRVAALQLRAGPDTLHPMLASYPQGTRVIVLGREPSGTWLYVEAPDGKTGWMMADFLDQNFDFLEIAEVDATPTSPHTPIPSPVPTKKTNKGQPGSVPPPTTPPYP